MGKITEALKKVSDERVARIQKMPAVRHVVKRVENSGFDQHIVAFHDSSSPITEQYRILRTNIQNLNHGKNRRSFIITSASGGEGKTITALNLAITMAHDLNNASILLIDADLRKRKLGKYVGHEDGHAGLTELLQGEAGPEEVFINTGIENLTMILSGKKPKNASELLNSKKMQELLIKMKAGFDYVLIDTPPVMPVTDACVLGPMVDGAIMVVRSGRTQREVVKQAQARLRQARTETVGCVLTNIEYHLPHYLYRYVQAHDDYDYAGKKEKA